MPDIVKVAARTLGLPEDASAETVFAKVDSMVALRRDRLVDAAVADGRIHAASRYQVRASLDKRGLVAERELAALAPVLTVTAAEEDRGLEQVFHAFGIDPAKARGRQS